jgi:excisionase family DNA binding protein
MQTLLTKGEAAALLRVSTRTIDRVRDSGNLLWVSVRGRVRFKIADLEKYIAKSTKGTQA